MGIVSVILQVLHGLVMKLAVPVTAFFLGKREAKHDFVKSLNEVLDEENKELRDNLGTPDNVLAMQLRERAAQKRKRKNPNKP